MWFGTPSDVGAEVNDGRGPVDFKISRGAKDKTLVEMKLAKNSHLERNLEKQVPIYQAASDAEHGIKAIFIESSINPAIIKAIAKESGARVGGELFSDAMGDPGQMEKGPDGEEYDVGTWVGMMKHNLNVIVQGLK